MGSTYLQKSAVFDRSASNAGFWQAHNMTMNEKPFTNKNFGMLNILDRLTVNSELINDGDITAKNFLKVEKGVNKGTVKGDNLMIDIESTFLNKGVMTAQGVMGGGTFSNQGKLQFIGTPQAPAKIGIKHFENGSQDVLSSKDTQSTPAKIKGSNIVVTSTNEKFITYKNSEIVMTNSLVFKEPETPSSTSLELKGNIHADILDIYRQETINAGTVSAATFSVHGGRFWNAVGALLHAKKADKPQVVIADVATFQNDGEMVVDHGTFIQKTGEFLNTGIWDHTGNIDLGSTILRNNGTLLWQKGTWTFSPQEYFNNGTWVLNQMACSQPLTIHNYVTLHLQNSKLAFSHLINHKNLILSGGQYTVKDGLQSNGLISFLEHDWTLTDDSTNTAPHRLVLDGEYAKKCHPTGEIESAKTLTYDLQALPESIRSKGDVIFSKRHAQGRMLGDLEKVSANGKVSFYTKDITTTKDYEFGNISHLDLYVDGNFTILDKTICPTITLNVNGKLLVGENKDIRKIYALITVNPEPSLSNQRFGTIAASHGVLTLVAHDIDASCAHVYGAHGTNLKATDGNIRVGSPDYLSHPTFMHYLSHFYIFKIKNGSYVESGGSLSLEASKDIIVDLGQLHSEGDQWFKAGNLIENVGGKISSEGNVFIQGIRYFNGRKGINPLTCLNIPHPANRDSYAKKRQQYVDFYPTSDRAILESLGDIHINVNRMDNVSSSILSGGDVLFNGLKIEKSPGGYYESILSTSDSAVNPQSYEPSEGLFSNYVWKYHDHGYELAHQLKMIINRHGLPVGARNAGCVLQTGKKIKINTGNAIISGNCNSRFIKVTTTDDLDIHRNRNMRRHIDPSRPLLVNQAKAIANQATPKGFIQPNARHELETEFPMGTPYQPKGKPVWLVRPDNEHLYKMPMNLGQVINRLRNLSSGHIGLSVQSTLSEWAGRVYIEGSKGNNLKALEAHADKFYEETGKSEVTPKELLDKASRSMVLWSLEQEENKIYQDMILYIAPKDINPSQGISGEKGIFHAGKNLTLHGAALEFEDDVSVTADEKLRLLTILKRIYTTNGHYDVIDAETKVTSEKGKVTAIGETGFQMKGATLRSFLGLIVGSTHGSSDIEDVLLSHLERHTHVEDGGFWGEDKTTYTETETTRSHASKLQSQSDNVMVVSGEKNGKTRITGSHLKAFLALIFKGKELETNASVSKHKSITNTEIEGAFSSSRASSMQESATLNPTTLEGSVIYGDTEKATYRGTDFLADIFYDNTKDGAALEPTIAMLEYFQQTVSESAFAKSDVGCKGGYEVMHPCRLMVNKVIRTLPEGEMQLNSVLWDKDRTELIGKFSESTYELKKWHSEWAIHEQLIPTEALVVVALAVGYATQGWGSSLISKLSSAMFGTVNVAATATTAATVGPAIKLSTLGIAVANAGVSAVCSRIVTSGLQTGDLSKVAKDLTSADFVRSLGISMLSAGLCQHIGAALKIDMNPSLKEVLSEGKIKPVFTDFLQSQALKSSVNAGLNVALGGQPAQEALITAAKDVALNSVAAWASYKVGDAGFLGKMTPEEQDLAHTGIGTLFGVATHLDKPLEGAITGGLNAFAAARASRIMFGSREEIKAQAEEELRQQGRPVTKENLETAVNDLLHQKTAISMLLSASATAAITRDPGLTATGIFTATNVVENNCVPSMTKSVLVSEGLVYPEKDTKDGFWQDECADPDDLYWEMSHERGEENYGYGGRSILEQNIDEYIEDAPKRFANPETGFLEKLGILYSFPSLCEAKAEAVATQAVVPWGRKEDPYFKRWHDTNQRKIYDQREENYRTLHKPNLSFWEATGALATEVKLDWKEWANGWIPVTNTERTLILAASAPILYSTRKEIAKPIRQFMTSIRKPATNTELALLATELTRPKQLFMGGTNPAQFGVMPIQVKEFKVNYLVTPTNRHTILLNPNANSRKVFAFARNEHGAGKGFGKDIPLTKQRMNVLDGGVPSPVNLNYSVLNYPNSSQLIPRDLQLHLGTGFSYKRLRKVEEVILEDVVLQGHNPGNVKFRDGLLRVQTEILSVLPDEGARNLFSRLTGQKISKDCIELTEKFLDGRVIAFRREGRSGHPKIEITSLGNGSKEKVREKITFKQKELKITSNGNY